MQNYYFCSESFDCYVIKMNLFSYANCFLGLANYEVIFLTRPYVEYKGSVPQNELQSKTKELELEANALISSGGKVSFTLFFFVWV